MIAMAMHAAIRPYSMAVAPDSSFTKRVTRTFIDRSLDPRSCLKHLSWKSVMRSLFPRLRRRLKAVDCMEVNLTSKSFRKLLAPCSSLTVDYSLILTLAFQVGSEPCDQQKSIRDSCIPRAANRGFSRAW